MTETLTRPPHIEPRRWDAAPWHAKQKAHEQWQRQQRPDIPDEPEPCADPPAELPITREEVVAYVEARLSQRVPTSFICEELETTPGALKVRLRRADRDDLASVFRDSRKRRRTSVCKDCGAVIWSTSLRCQGCAQREVQSRRLKGRS